MSVSTTKRAPARKTGGGSSASKTFSFRGIKLPAPTKVPDTLAFDLGDIQLRAEEGDMSVVLGRIQGILEEMLGREELVKVRGVVKGLDDPWQKELLEKVIELAGGDESGKS